MRSLLFIALFIFSFNFSSFASDVKIAIVSYSRIENEAKVMQNITSQIKARQDKLQTEMKSIETDVQKKVEELEKSASVLTEKALQQKKLKLQQELIQLDENLKKKAAKLEEIKNETLLDLNAKIKVIVQNVSKNGGYEITFSDAAVVYFQTKYDITDVVIKELNKEVPSMKIDWDRK